MFHTYPDNAPFFLFHFLPALFPPTPNSTTAGRVVAQVLLKHKVGVENTIGSTLKHGWVFGVSVVNIVKQLHGLHLSCSQNCNVNGHILGSPLEKPNLMSSLPAKAEQVIVTTRSAFAPVPHNSMDLICPRSFLTLLSSMVSPFVE
jgi:hypothetical protein